MKRKKETIDLFLDSGAFSAWSKGEQIDIQEYISFIKKHKRHINVYANLDVIGDPEATLKNQQIMEKAGLSPLPCYHYGEPIKYLKHYISKYDYVALGGMVPISSKDLVIWLDDLFSNHIPTETKIHGFGMTSLQLMIRYPWFSVDSTNWVVQARTGSVYIPRFVKREYVYDKNAWAITFSSRSPQKSEAGKHFDTLPNHEQKIIENYIRSKGYVIGKSEFKTVPVGYELRENEKWFGKKRNDGSREVEIIIEEGISNNYQLRDEMNIIFFLDLEKSLPKWPWAFKPPRRTKGLGL